MVHTWRSNRGLRDVDLILVQVFVPPPTCSTNRSAARVHSSNWIWKVTNSKRYLKSKTKISFRDPRIPLFCQYRGFMHCIMYCLSHWRQPWLWGGHPKRPTWTHGLRQKEGISALAIIIFRFQLFIFGEVLQLCLSYLIWSCSCQVYSFLSIQEPRETGKC